VQCCQLHGRLRSAVDACVQCLHAQKNRISDERLDCRGSFSLRTVSGPVQCCFCSISDSCPDLPSDCMQRCELHACVRLADDARFWRLHATSHVTRRNHMRIVVPILLCPCSWPDLAPDCKQCCQLHGCLIFAVNMCFQRLNAVRDIEGYAMHTKGTMDACSCCSAHKHGTAI